MKNIFCRNFFFENNHKCVPSELLITNINLLLLLLFFYYWPCLYLFWISSPLNDIKYQLYYLKRCLCTQKFYLFNVTSFFLLLLVLFLCLLKIVYYCQKVFKMYLLYSWVLYIYGFVTLLPRFVLLVIKDIFFPEQL